MSDETTLRRYIAICNNHIAMLKKTIKIYEGYLADESLDPKHKKIYKTEISELNLEISKEEENIKEYKAKINNE